MPRYNFKCEACEKDWEEQLLIVNRDVPLTQECPLCHSTEGPIERFLPSTNGLAYTLEKVRVPDTFNDLIKNIAKTNYGKVNTGHQNT